MKPKIPIVVLVLSVIVSVGLYFYTFHYGLSKQPNDWMAFGNYLSGIAGLLNVIVFVWLTYEINALNNKEKERDRKHQEAVIKTKMRYDEFKWLVEQLNQVTSGKLSVLKYGELYSISLAINSFMETKELLFPFLKDKMVKKKFLEICNIINNLGNLLKKAAGCNEQGLPVNPPDFTLTQDFKNNLSDFHTKRNELIQIMETFILENIS